MNDGLISKRELIEKLSKIYSATDETLINSGMSDDPLRGLMRNLSRGMICFINDVPTVDAAPVVRCKDCKYGSECAVADPFSGIKFPAYHCAHDERRADTEIYPPEWFCAGGEPKEVNE